MFLLILLFFGLNKFLGSRTVEQRDLSGNDIEERPAYMNLSRQELKEAVEIADRMLSKGREEVDVLNQKSLLYRNTE